MHKAGLYQTPTICRLYRQDNETAAHILLDGGAFDHKRNFRCQQPRKVVNTSNPDKILELNKSSGTKELGLHLQRKIPGKSKRRT